MIRQYLLPQGYRWDILNDSEESCVEQARARPFVPQDENRKSLSLLSR